MRQATKATLLTLLLSGLGGCSQSTHVPNASNEEALPGGAGSVSTKPFPSFMRPASNLPQEKKPDFHAGKALAHQPWIKAPTITTARDGLGPIYNARTCLACHINGGRGKMPDDDKTALFSAFLRLSLPGKDSVNGAVPEPIYGDQLQSQSVALSHQLRQPRKSDSHEVAPEAYTYIDWQQQTFTYPDKTTVELRYPHIRLENLGYGEMHSDTLMGIRNAPPIHGVGLLELIDQKDINVHADPDDQNHDGISGRVNQVWNSETQQTEAGRFGLKANRPNLRIVTAAAFTGDVGITNPLFPDQPCTQAQDSCLNTANGNDAPDNVELPERLLTLVVNFTKNIGVPKRDAANDVDVLKGRDLFYQTGCSRCHVPSYTTQTSENFPHLAEQTIWPYTDLLIHDMGPELADNRPDFEASGSEWRTPPLWGAGLGKAVNGSDNLLHDGRAQSVEAAILWHGGEALTIKETFTQLPKAQRHLLITFVESL